MSICSTHWGLMMIIMRQSTRSPVRAVAALFCERLSCCVFIQFPDSQKFLPANLKFGFQIDSFHYWTHAAYMERNTFLEWRTLIFGIGYYWNRRKITSSSFCGFPTYTYFINSFHNYWTWTMKNTFSYWYSHPLKCNASFVPPVCNLCP